MARIKHKIAVIALASSVVLGTAGVAQADTNDGSTPTTVAPKTSKKEYAKKLREYKTALKTYNQSKNAVQATYVKAVKDATAAKKTALKAAKTKDARKAALDAFSTAMKAAKDAKAAAITALGAAPTAPTAP